MASGDGVGEILEYTTHKFSVSYMIVREKITSKNPPIDWRVSPELVGRSGHFAERDDIVSRHLALGPIDIDYSAVVFHQDFSPDVGSHIVWVDHVANRKGFFRLTFDAS